jgi:hypothetical protein
VYPLGPQTVSMKLPSGVQVRSVELLRGGRNVPFQVVEGLLHFAVPTVPDYEVAAIAVA